MAAELTQHRDRLEDLVADRTYRLELVTMLSGYLSTILDIDQMLETMVNKIKENFGYYHVHVYLFDPETKLLEMRAGAGEIGKALKAQKHQLKLGQGIVGTVASQQSPFLSNEV